MENVFERFVRWCLRLNGFFTVENFYVHAAGDPTRCTAGVVGASTEADLLAVRMPYSKEVSGGLFILNDPVLTVDERPRLDFVIAEVKSGNSNKPNSCWRSLQGLHSVEYLVRFLGQFPEDQIATVAADLLKSYTYADENCRIRYIVFAEEGNREYTRKGVQYVRYADIVDFFVSRGGCWARAGVGVVSLHEEWDPLIKKVFEIAHSTAPSRERHRLIAELIPADRPTASKAS